jgi:alkylhydroperoxidase family enzyme
MIGPEEAEGALAEAYARLKAASGPRPSIYTPPTGSAPNIIRCHSLEPEGLRLAFTMSAAVHWRPHSLPWPVRELINTVTSRLNRCFY